MIKTKTVETIREYDEQGKLVKETVTETEETNDYDNYKIYPSYPSCPNPWWQNPIVTYSNVTVGDNPDAASTATNG